MKRALLMVGVLVLAVAAANVARADSLTPGDTLYATEATFVLNLQPLNYLEDFGYTEYALLASPVSFGPVNGYSYSASAPQGLFKLPQTGSLSTNSDTDALTITFTGSPVTALGGIFTGTDFNGFVTPSTLVVHLADGTLVTLPSPGNSTFTGFTTAVAIASLDITTGGGNVYPTLDHFYVGAAASAAPVPVPLPSSVYGVAGLLGLGVVGKRLRFNAI